MTAGTTPESSSRTWTPPGPPVPIERPAELSCTRLGLHVTGEELAVWRERAREGPYRVRGDAMPNSPGDWARIEAHAEAFRRAPEAGRWPGPQRSPVWNSSRWPRDLRGAPPRQGGPEELRDAAFHAMVAEPADTSDVVALVRDEILWHVERPELDFTDRRRYPRWLHGRGYHPAYQIAAWLRKLMYAFDYARIAAPDVWTDDQQRRVLAWLGGAADWHASHIDANRRLMWTPGGRPSPLATAWGGPAARPVFAGGPTTRRIQHKYNNHVCRYAVFVTDVGILTGDERLMGYGRRWIDEFLAVCVYPQGAISDFYRWDDDRRGHLQAWKYGMYMVGASLIVADHLARAGDRSGYEAATVDGTEDTAGATPDDGITWGGPKTLHTAARQMMRFVDEDSQPPRYACRDCSDERRRLSSRDPIRGIERVDDWFLLQGNVYLRDPYLQALYLRQLPGTPPLPEDPAHSLGWAQNGDVGTFPGVNLMFAQMEGVVWPYPEPADA